MVAAWARRNRRHDVSVARSGAGGIRRRLRILRIVDAPTRLLLVTPNTHERVTQGADVHSSIQAPSVVAEERVKVESPQRSEENRP
jgi:hypothetical protein